MAHTIKPKAATVETVASACITRIPNFFPPTAIHARYDACHSWGHGNWQNINWLFQSLHPSISADRNYTLYKASYSSQKDHI